MSQTRFPTAISIRTESQTHALRITVAARTKLSRLRRAERLTLALELPAAMPILGTTGSWRTAELLMVNETCRSCREAPLLRGGIISIFMEETTTPRTFLIYSLEKQAGTMQRHELSLPHKANRETTNATSLLLDRSGYGRCSEC